MQRQGVTTTGGSKMEMENQCSPRPSASYRFPHSPLHQLQHALGNRAVGQFVQAKLKISQPGDAYEQEADRVADQVMRMPDAAPLKDRTAIEHSAAPARIQRACSKCEEDVEENAILRQAAEASDELTLQLRSRVGPSVKDTAPIATQINNLTNSGEPLPESTRAYFEPRFGMDFSHVRVHQDGRAAESAQAVSALAYTTGHDIVFGAGQFAPTTNKGLGLLAHELTHVVQQGGAEQNKAAKSPLSYGSDLPKSPEVHLRDSQPAVRRFTELEYECSDFRGPCPEDSQDNIDSREAIRRMMETTAGRWLIGALRANDNLQSSRIISAFASNLARPEAGIFGSFHPRAVGASTYTAYIDTVRHIGQGTGTATPQPAESPLPAPVSTYGGGTVVIPTYIRERPSMLAETLFHELLHVWYLNTYSDLELTHPDTPRWGIEPFTGHANAALGEIERPYADRLRQFAVQIYRVETRPRAAPAQPAMPQQPQPRAPAPSPEVTEPGGTHLSFEAGVAASYYRLPPATQGQLGLDFRLGFLYGRAIRFGASADLLYLPQQGFVGVGGEVGVRILQTEEHFGTTQIAENPMFFDINAGMVYMLRPGDPVIGSLGAGVGQEYGRPGGWAPFWQVGAALQASPTAAMNQFGFSAGLTVGVRR